MQMAPPHHSTNSQGGYPKGKSQTRALHWFWILRSLFSDYLLNYWTTTKFKAYLHSTMFTLAENYMQQLCFIYFLIRPWKLVQGKALGLLSALVQTQPPIPDPYMLERKALIKETFATREFLAGWVNSWQNNSMEGERRTKTYPGECR